MTCLRSRRFAGLAENAGVAIVAASAVLPTSSREFSAASPEWCWSLSASCSC